MADIFVSYKTEERSLAKELAQSFEAEGWSVWSDEQITIGDKFDETIRRELEGARLVVALWSSKSIHSDYIKGEAREANAQDKLLSVFVDDVSEKDLPYDLQSIQGVMLESQSGAKRQASLSKLLGDIAARLGREMTTKERELQGKLTEALSKLNERASSKWVIGNNWAFLLGSFVAGVVLAFSVHYVIEFFHATTDSVNTVHYEYRLKVKSAVIEYDTCLAHEENEGGFICKHQADDLRDACSSLLGE